MPAERSNPDQWLARARAEERYKKRGKLKIFFGAAPGVGKTYAMLEEARKLYTQGVDVLIGVAEPHGRSETAMLLLGLEILPPRSVEYHDTILSEFDLDAALARRPAILLMDELAHSNAPGSRFQKRYQDVEALLAAGIDIFTTLNVQHLESLKDIVAKITEIEVRETVPDSVFDGADEVELVDLPPDDLLTRLHAGKVYIPSVAKNAMLHFFRKGNLTALRELALRRTAEWVDRQMQNYKKEHGIAAVWPAGERILVCVGPNANASKIVRAAKRLAISLRAELIAVYVERPLKLKISESDREQVLSALRLAESVGAETVTLNNAGIGKRAIAVEILEYARSRNVTKIVLGRGSRAPWRERLFGSNVQRLLQNSPDVDLFIIQNEEGELKPSPNITIAPPRSGPASYGYAVAAVGIVTGVSFLVSDHLNPANIAMLYLIGVLVTAIAAGRGPSIAASIVSVAAFDFFFVQPTLTFAVADSEYIITFLVMLVVGLVSSSLTVRLREQARMARDRERQSATLYAMARELAAARGEAEVLKIGTRHLRDSLGGEVAILRPDGAGSIQISDAGLSDYSLDDTERGAAQWSFDHLQSAGLGTTILPSARAIYLPLAATQGVVGVVGFRPRAGDPLAPARQHLLDTFASQLALAIERVSLIRKTQDSNIRAEAERTRNALLSSVSHDLRTPLAVITGSASTLAQNGAALADETRRALIAQIYEEASRLGRLIENLVFATRLDDGGIQLKKEWCSIEELVGGALRRVDESLKNRPVKTYIPADLPMVRADSVLMEQVIVNLLENALRYSPADSPIDIFAWKEDGRLIIKISDDGPGIPTGEEEKLFDRFYRGPSPPRGTGLGLGLYICRGIVNAHDGRVWGERRADRGSSFFISLPIEPAAPAPEAS